MKKKIFNLSLVLILTIAVLFSLTACGDDDEKEEESSSSTAEGMLEEFYSAMNKHDVDKMMDYIDVDTLSEIAGDSVDEKEIKEYLEDFFEDNDDFTVKAKKAVILKDDKEVSEDMLEEYDSYEEFIEEGEEEFDLKGGLDVYTVKITLPDDYDDYYAYGYDGKDIAIVRKAGSKYKVIYTMTLQNIISESMYNGYDSYYDDDDADVEAFNSKYESYEGDSITGKKVKELIDKVITNNEEDEDFENPIYITTYDEDGYLDVSMAYSTSELEDIKSEIATTHNYEVEFEEGSTGRVRYIDVKY